MKEKLPKPKILVDTREHQMKVINALKEDGSVEIGSKSGGPADYVIVDRAGNEWGIERKSFLDAYSSIIGKEASGGHRIYGQLAEMIERYDGRAIFLLEAPKYFRKELGNPYIIIQSVYTFFSERSLVMPCMITRDERHTAYLLLKLAKSIHVMEFRGRGYRISVDTKSKR